MAKPTVQVFGKFLNFAPTIIRFRLYIIYLYIDIIQIIRYSLHIKRYGTRTTNRIDEEARKEVANLNGIVAIV